MGHSYPSSYNDNYSGGGLICVQHFPPETIQGSGSRIHLKKGTTPSIFLVDIDPLIGEEPPSNCENCKDLESKNEEIQTKLFKVSLDSEVDVMKFKNKIEKLESIVHDKDCEAAKMKRKIRALEIKNKSLEEKLFISKTVPDINVSMDNFWFVFET